MSLRDSILSSEDIKFDTVHVEEWDETIRVKSMSASDTEQLQRYQEKNANLPNQDYMGYLACLVIVDDDGKRVFTEPGDSKLLGAKSVAALSKVLSVAAKLNGDLELTGLNEEAAAKN